MKASLRDAPLLSWDPFSSWESSQSNFDSDLNDSRSLESVESALPGSVETDDEENPEMGPACFTYWF